MRKLAVSVLVCLLSACSSAETSTLGFQGERAYDDVATQVAFGPRVPGTEPHKRAEGWIRDQLELHGWRVESQSFVYRGVPLTNLIASRGQKEGQPIILGAHYDTRPLSDRSPEFIQTPVPGANDGASGVAVLLELARVLPESESRFPIWLVFFDGEDSGGIGGWDWIVGSNYFASQLSTRPLAVVIVDMVGDEQLELPRELNSTPWLQSSIWQKAEELGYSQFMDQPGYRILDDHTPFLRDGIPAVDIIDFEYPYWHTPQDTLDKVSGDSLKTVGETLNRWLLETDFNKLAPPE